MAFDAVEDLVTRRLRIETIAKTLQEKHMSPPEVLKLPPLLELRRQKYLLPDEVFGHQALFDRVLVMQLSERDDADNEKFEGTNIFKTQSKQAADLEALPRGVLVSAGLKALDNLRANGIDIGHVVTFIKQAPFRLPLGTVEGVNFNVLVMRDGDLNTSEDLVRLQRAGKVRVEIKEFNGAECHCFVDESGKQWNPACPQADFDY